MVMEIILSLCLVLLIRNIFTTYKMRRKMPPGQLPFPFIGNIPQILCDPLYPFGRLSQKYGDIFTLSSPVGTIVVLNNAKLIRTARLGTKDDLAGRTPHSMYPWSVIHLCKNVATADYSTAYLFRKRVFKTALHAVGNSVEKVGDRARNGVEKAINEIDLKKGEPFSALELFESSILAQLWEWLTSKSVPLDDTIVKSARELGYLLTNLAKQSSLYQLFPFLSYFPTKFNSDIKRAQKLVCEIFPPEFYAHHKTYTSGIIRDLTDSFISSYEKEHAKETIMGIGTIEDIPYLMLDVIIAGTDTTSTALSWFILYMVLHEDVQMKIQKEIDTLVTNDRAPAWQDVQNMSYLQATLCEVLRISGLVQYTGTNAIRDTTVGDYHVPKGTLVVLNLKQALRDEREWPEPDTFRPERFLDSDGKFVGWSKLHGFVPFGLGRRECLGQSVAKIMMLTYASTLLHRYKFELPEEAELPTTKVCPHALLLRPDDFKVLAKHRF